MRKKILVIAAHPDDEILGCGGTVAKLASEGHSVTLAILGEGVTSRQGLTKQQQTAALKTLHKTSHAVAKAIGAKEVVLENLPDNRFDSVPLLDVVQIVEKLITKVKPQTVFTHSNSDLNIDHRVTFQAVLTALRPMKGSSVEELYSFETPSATEWSFGRIADGFRPSCFFDISKTLSTKLKALGLYEGEMREFPHPRSLENIEHLAKTRGAAAGFKAAEAFEVIFQRR